MVDVSKDVDQFSKKFSLPRLSKPGFLSEDDMMFRLKFLKEELDEVNSAYSSSCHRDQEELCLAEFLDGLVDLVYVAVGTAWLMNLPFDEAWSEVHRANMSKMRVPAADLSLSKRKHPFDVVKPPSFVAPDLVSVLRGTRRLRTTRSSREECFLAMARVVATRSTCARRAVGCILINEDNHVLATGYNGVPSGATHCIAIACPGAELPSGTGLDQCRAIHAEQNALMQCHDVMQIYEAYCTASPCMSCVKMLLNTSCRRIVFAEEYPHPEAKAMWEEAGRQWG